MQDSFACRGSFEAAGKSHKIARLSVLEEQGHDVGRLPFALRILLENLLRHEDGVTVTREDIEALLTWDPKAEPSKEIAFRPARVLMQDFTGVPAVVDLAAMRDAMRALGGDAKRINPLQPAELVIDHSVQVDAYGSPTALARNAELEFERNSERYSFLRWGQSAFEDFKVVPPATGIVHQVNLEYLARVVFDSAGSSTGGYAYPDTLVGTDSHTTMINGVGVLGWGVGGIEAEAAMLGQPVSMLIPQVVGVRLTGRLPEGSTATDLVLRVTEVLRKHGVVGKFVEFLGEGLAELPVADRATISNMAPEYGATCGIFPVDEATLGYLRLTGRPDEQVALVEAYMKEQGMFHVAGAREAEYSDMLELDLGTIVPSLAGPRRPQDRVALSDMAPSFAKARGEMLAALGREDADTRIPIRREDGTSFELKHGSVVIAAITSCTNTSNPSVMMAAGLLARKAAEKGLRSKPWVKTSLAPGSKVVTEYLERAGLIEPLNALGFDVVGYGCTTCIGNSGPLPPDIERAIDEGGLVASSVLSGNRNFEGRVHTKVRASYLASPPLVVAYALAGDTSIDLTTQPLGRGSDGQDVFLKDVWPSAHEVAEAVKAIDSRMFQDSYGTVYTGNPEWNAIEFAEGDTYAWDDSSTYVKNPPYFEGMGMEPGTVEDIAGARALAKFGDSITTDHISPAGSIAEDSPAGRYLVEHGVEKKDFNSYGSRRGNHEVMMRGTFANVRIKNQMVPGVEGGYTVHVPSGERLSIYDAAMRYMDEGTPTIVLGGKEYGTGSSRDWAAKGPRLQGVRAVIVESFERIHRSNLVGMGILPLQYLPGESADSHGLTGMETFEIRGLAERFAGEEAPTGGRVAVTAVGADGKRTEFQAQVRIDTPQEAFYYRHGGILPYVLRRLASGS